MTKPNTTNTIVVRDAQAPFVRAALANLKQGGYPIAELSGPLEDDLGNIYWTLSGNFTQSQLAKLRGVFKATRILKDTAYWEHEGRDTEKIRRDRGLRPKSEEKQVELRVR